MKEKYYITTAIDYVNAEPHIGHAYQKIVADVLARWNKLLDKDVFFLTGTDEHGKKVQTAAQSKNRNPKDFVDEISLKFIDSWKKLNINYDRFIRTTDSDHQEFVKQFIQKCYDKGDIYKGIYSGFYCVGCENYVTEKDLIDGKCPIHSNKKIEKIEEETYFFKLSKYKDFLLDLYENNPEFIQPESRRNEIINRVKQGLRDLSITRTSFNWGIPFPLDDKHVTYVWFDALINYLSGAGKNQEYWPADVHLLGKDNTWFHTVYWPAMLKSADYKLPKITFNHGFLSFNGQKISKSLGNSISPNTLVEKYGVDTIRYFVLRHFPFASGDDGNFDEEALVNRHNTELLNKLGNLISRTSGLIEKYGYEKTNNSLNLDLEKIKDLYEKFEFDKIINEIFAFIDKCNLYLQDKKPWETKDKKVLYEIADAIKQFTIPLYPIIPKTCEKISQQFKFNLTLEQFNKPLEIKEIKKQGHLFSRIE